MAIDAVLPIARRDLAQRNELRLTFDVEAQDAFFERIGHLTARLADAREDDLGRRHAGSSRTPELALRDDVHAGTEPTHRCKHGLIGVGFDGEADERVLVAKSVRQNLVVTLERRGRIAIEGRADLRRDTREADVLGVENAGLVVEVMHWEFRSSDSSWLLVMPAKAGIRPGQLSRRTRKFGSILGVSGKMEGKSRWERRCAGLPQQRIEDERLVRLLRSIRVLARIGRFGRFRLAGGFCFRRRLERSLDATAHNAKARRADQRDGDP